MAGKRGVRKVAKKKPVTCASCKTQTKSTAKGYICGSCKEKAQDREKRKGQLSEINQRIDSLREDIQKDLQRTPSTISANLSVVAVIIILVIAIALLLRYIYVV